MDTLHLPEAGRSRRRYSAEFKAQLLAACQQPGISITAIALANQINPNVVRRWLRDLRSAPTVPVVTDVACPDKMSVQPAACPSGLVPVEVVAVAPQPCRTNGAQAAHADSRHESPSVSQVSSSSMLPAEPIQVELHRGETLLKVAWPAAHADVCALWLRGLMP
jgi:transposase